MMNKDRVVPVTAIDLLSLYAVILKAAGTTLTAVNSDTVDGVFSINENPANAVIASEPVKSFDFAGTTSAATVYFVPTYDYEGFKVAGAAVTTAGDEVVADHANLYSATLATGTVTIAKVGL
jgi:hypothetical protein